MSQTRVNWTITDRNVSVNWEGQSHIVPRTDALADRLIEAVKEGRLNEIPDLVSAAKRIEKYSKGNFLVQDGRVMVDGQPAPEVLSNKIIRFSNEGLPLQPLLKFAANLQSNPSYRAVNELFSFLEKNDHPLTENGNFIAYKRVRENFKDIHSGTMDNSVGQVVEVPRNQVDEDSSRTCSHGLHVANWTYAHTQFASHNPDTDIMLEVEVNPADVVAIPVDYDNAKMRVCKYKVLGVVTTPFEPTQSLKVTGYNPFNDMPGTEPDFDGDCIDCDNTGCSSCRADICADCECEVCECEKCDYCDCEICECDTDCSQCEDGECCGECSCCDRYPYEDELQS